MNLGKRLTVMRLVTGLTTVAMFAFYKTSSDTNNTNGMSFSLWSQQQNVERQLRSSVDLSNTEFGLRKDGTLLVPVFGERLERKDSVEKGMCDLLTEKSDSVKRLHVHNSICGDDSLGNYIIHLYSWHLLAHLAQIPFTFTCGIHLGGPSVMSLTRIDETEKDVTSPADLEFYTVKEFCDTQSKGQFWKSKTGGLEHSHAIVSRGMDAVAKSPQGQSFEADDAVIHIRLHDALKPTPKVGSQRGLFKHSAYARLLKQVQLENEKPLETISLVTAPFHEDGVREKDLAFLDRSKMIGLDLQDYLADEFPSAKVTIHNSLDETPIKAFARLTRAKQVAICGCSTFCPLPVFGVQPEVKGFVWDSPHYSFFNKYFAQTLPNIETWDDPMLGNALIEDMTDEQLLSWLRDTPTSAIE